MVETLLRTLATATLVLGLSACADVRGLARKVQRTCEESGQERFFGDQFVGLPEAEQEVPKYYASLLEAGGEPSLSCDGNFDDAFRILFSGAKGTALIIRLTTSNGRSTITSVALDAKSRKALSKSEQTITLEQFKTFSEAVNGFNFWTRSPNPSPTATARGVIVLHSGTWIFEGRVDNWYHVIRRGEFPREREFNVVGRQLFEMADYVVPGEFLVPEH